MATKKSKSSKAVASKGAKPKTKAPAQKKPEKKPTKTTKKSTPIAPAKKKKEEKKKSKSKSSPAPASKKNKTGKSKNKTTSSKGKGKGKKPEAKSKKGKGKPVTKSKSGKKGKNKGSSQYQTIKRILLERYKRRCNIVTDKDASQTASNILKWLKTDRDYKNRKNRKTVTHKLIKKALDELFPREQRRLGRKVVPDIPDYAQSPNEFYNIEDVIKDIDNGVYKRVWIYSPLILGKKGNGYVFLDGNKSYTYDETFQGWVDYINEQIKEGNFKEGSPPDVWYRFLEVFWNKRRKRWEVKIIPCDVDGNEFNTGYILGEDVGTDTTEEDYGINPDDVEAEKKAKAEAEQLAKQAEEDAKKRADEEDKKKSGAAPPTAEEAKEVTQAKKKAEEAREKDFRVQTLIRVKQSIMDEIKFMKEIGEPYTDQIAKLKEVNTKIEELWKY